MGGVLYALVMGAVTGYFSVAVGLLFVLAGIIGIVSVAFQRKAIAAFYMMVLCVVNVVGLIVNLAGAADPSFLSTTSEKRDVGFMTITPGVVWFFGGLVFMALFCIPCITISVVNLYGYKRAGRVAPEPLASQVELQNNVVGSIPVVQQQQRGRGTKALKAPAALEEDDAADALDDARERRRRIREERRKRQLQKEAKLQAGGTSSNPAP
eukprot:m51a1_g2958 hypothetical protein (210) ;mRNA; f:661531-662317